MLALVAKPMDELVLNLLRLDDSGRVLADLTSRRTSPVREAQRALAEALRDTFKLAELVSLFYPAADKQKLMGLLRSMVVQLSGAVWYRLDAVLQRFPFALLRTVHPECNPVEQLAAAQRLYATRLCCLDPYCSARLRNLFPTARKLSESACVRRVLLAWMNRGKATT